jgi:hypothetical protein
MKKLKQPKRKRKMRNTSPAGRISSPTPMTLNKAAPPPVQQSEDPTMTQYLSKELENLIDRFGTCCNGLSNHCDTLMGVMPAEATDRGQAEGSNQFSVIEAKLRILRNQASWLESTVQRVYRI